MRLAVPLLLVVAGLLLSADPAWAWGPATHVYLGMGVLDALHLVPPAMRSLLAAYPYDFLYGSVAADISLAKKYVPEGRHCHHWHVGEEIYATADTERLCAMSLGYLAHLAADTVAHNTFVPRQLLLTSSSKGLGHSYWEHRMDVQLGERYTAMARHVVMDHDHSAADALFDRVLSATLFSFRTNRRIFRGMIRFQDNDRWQSIMETLIENSRWTLSDDAIEAYVVRSFDYVVDYLSRRGAAIPAGLDPVGERNLTLSKQVRRMALREGKLNAPMVLRQLADDFFPMPEVPFGYWERRNRASSAAGGE
ncbi:MAG TPA: zinc dependent phospholipase C family protein [Longimicrobiaceae bacterium]|nr:zinc dependent phospholipase C family protein [Longimicrobiaceae bacterium]